MEIFDVLVLGGGPGGYLCAERASQNGLKAAVFEKKALGGTCLNEGCIPTKTFLNSAKIYDHTLHGEKFGVTANDIKIDHKAVVARKNDVRSKLVAGIAAVLVNLVLNYTLILGNFGAPALGVVGAAIATVTSRFVECLIVVWWTHRHKEKNPYIVGVYKSLMIPGDVEVSYT